MAGDLISLADFRRRREQAAAARRAPATPPEEHYPLDARALDLGVGFHEECEYEQAERHYRVALLLQPTFQGYFNLGILFDDMGRDREAIDTYQLALQLEPHHPDVHFNLARLHERLGDRTAALRHLKAYRKYEKGKK